MCVGSKLLVAAIAAAALATAAAAATTGSSASASRDVISEPASIADGRLVFCSDLGYPPMESLQGSRPIGADIDIGLAIARSMQAKAEFRNVGFDGIIAALLAKQCDAILSGMTDTAERRKQVDFTTTSSWECP
jgi:polar amino acid transport system substrate-binding protein